MLVRFLFCRVGIYIVLARRHIHSRKPREVFACGRRHCGQRAAMRYLLLPVFLFLLSVSFASCEKRNDVDHLNNIDEERVKQLIAELDAGSNPNDARSSVIYNKSIEELTNIGSGAEPFLVFELNESNNWAIKYGCIEVLDSIGSKQCIEALIARLRDVHPKVAMKAMYSLRVICSYRVVPEKMPEDAKTVVEIPPVPVRGASQDMAEDYNMWVDWYDAHGVKLHAQWEQWWLDNKATIKIE